MSPHAMSASSSFLSWSFPSRAGVGHCAWSNAALVYRRCTCKGMNESAPRSTLAERPSHIQDYSALRFSLVAEYSGDCTERRKKCVLFSSGRVPYGTVIQKHRRAPGSRCHHSFTVCVIPCKSLRDGSSGGVVLQGRPVPALPGSGPRFRCPGFLRLNETRAETDRIGPPSAPNSSSALRTCHHYSVHVP